MRWIRVFLTIFTISSSSQEISKTVLFSSKTVLPVKNHRRFYTKSTGNILHNENLSPILGVLQILSSSGLVSRGAGDRMNVRAAAACLWFGNSIWRSAARDGVRLLRLSFAPPGSPQSVSQAPMGRASAWHTWGMQGWRPWGDRARVGASRDAEQRMGFGTDGRTRRLARSNPCRTAQHAEPECGATTRTGWGRPEKE